MADIFKPIKRKINHTIIYFVWSGFLLIVMGLLIVWTDFLLRLLVGTVVVTIALMFFYAAYRIYSIKREIEKYFKI